jgi:hypothetical protein
MKQLPRKGAQQNQCHARLLQFQRWKLGIQQEEPYHSKPKGQDRTKAIPGHQLAEFYLGQGQQQYNQDQERYSAQVDTAGDNRDQDSGSE